MRAVPTTVSQPRPFVGRRLLRWAIATPAAAIVLMGIAGDFSSPYLWAIVIGAAAVALYAIFTISPDLARERYHPPTSGADGGALHWMRPLALASLVFALVDGARWHWSAPMPAAWRIVGVTAFLLGLAGFVYAMSVNRFFSSVVRIQDDRGHHVIDVGPYARVRHPGYVGMLLFALALPLAFGSWWTFVAGAPMVAFALHRVWIEDAFLLAHLPGYREYADRVRYRLVPGAW
jgi:protein-S-isoprenylcysteine O-methyltransferase Ste14